MGNGVSAKLAQQSNRSPRCGTMLQSQSVKDASYHAIDAASLESLHREREDLRAKADQQSEEIDDLRINLDGLEQERDYYFKKLREVEILMETMKANVEPDCTAEKLLDDVQRILYDPVETEEANAGLSELTAPC